MIATVLRRQLAGSSRAIIYTLGLPCRLIPGDGVVWNRDWATMQVARVIIGPEGQTADCGPAPVAVAEELITKGGWEFAE